MLDPRTVIRAYVATNILFSGDSYSYPDEASFLDEGIVDSMNVLELVTFVTETFGITVDDREIVPDNFDSVAKLAAFVTRKARSRSTAAVDATCPQPASAQAVP